MLFSLFLIYIVYLVYLISPAKTVLHIPSGSVVPCKRLLSSADCTVTKKICIVEPNIVSIHVDKKKDVLICLIDRM